MSVQKNKGAWVAFYFSALMQSRKWVRMTAEQQAVYVNLLGAQFDGGPLPTDIEELAFLATKNTADLSPLDFERIWTRPLTDCFEDTERGLENPRMAHEVEMAGSRSKKARIASEERWRRERAKKADSDANALPKHSSSNANAVLEQCASNAIQSKANKADRQSKERNGASAPDALASALEKLEPQGWVGDVLRDLQAHHRELKGKPLTQRGWEAKIKTALTFGEATMRASVASSVENGWRGVFPEKVAQATTQAPSAGSYSKDAPLKSGEKNRIVAEIRMRYVKKTGDFLLDPDVAMDMARKDNDHQAHDLDWRTGRRNDPPPLNSTPTAALEITHEPPF